MNRRELLKSMAPLAMVPLVIKGEKVGGAIQLDPQAKYLVFIDSMMIDSEEFCRHEHGLPDGTVVHSVLVPPDRTIDEAIRIFKVDP